MGTVIIVKRQSQLFQIVRALHAPGRFTSGLYGGEQKRDQDADDCNDDKKFDKSESLGLAQAAPPPPF